MDTWTPTDEDLNELPHVVLTSSKNGIPIGTANDNPLLDTRMYEVKHVDGRKQALAANIIA